MTQKHQEKIEILLSLLVLVGIIFLLTSSPKSISKEKNSKSKVEENYIKSFDRTKMLIQKPALTFKKTISDYVPDGSTISPSEMMELLQNEFPDLILETGEKFPEENESLTYFTPSSRENYSKVIMNHSPNINLEIYHSFDEIGVIEDFQINKAHIELIHLEFRRGYLYQLKLNSGIVNEIELKFNEDMAMNDHYVGHFWEKKDLDKVDPTVKPIHNLYKQKVDRILKTLCVDFKDMKACEAFKEISQIKNF